MNGGVLLLHMVVVMHPVSFCKLVCATAYRAEVASSCIGVFADFVDGQSDGIDPVEVLHVSLLRGLVDWDARVPL